MSSSSFSSVSSLPLSFSKDCKCSYHPREPNCMLISTHVADLAVTPGIYQYNLQTDETKLLYKYSNTTKRFFSKYVYHGQFVDPVNNALYLYGGCSNTFAVFDLNNNELQQLNNNDSLNGTDFVCAYVPAPNNEVHILNLHRKHAYNPFTMKHCVFQIKNKCFIEKSSKSCSVLNKENIEYPHLLYVPFKQRLMMFGCYFDNKICEYNNNEWKLNTVRMPFAVSDQDYAVLLGFTNIVFVFYFDKRCGGDIYLLDLLYDEWFKSKVSVPQCLFQRFGEISKRFVWKVDDTAHFVHFENKYHFVVPLYDLVPGVMMKKRRKYCNSLVMGYLREEEHVMIPLVLKQLILKYFSLFA